MDNEVSIFFTYMIAGRLFFVYQVKLTWAYDAKWRKKIIPFKLALEIDAHGPFLI